MYIKSKIIFKYEKGNQAEISCKSLKPDNMDFVDSYTENKSLICELKGSSIRTILATEDDLIFCQMMVGKIMEFIEDRISR